MEKETGITKEQMNILRKFADEEYLVHFFTRLNFNFGGGEVLSFKQINSYFENDLHKNSNTDMLTVFIDTIRVLRLLKQDEDDILGLKDTEVMILHDKLNSEYSGTVDEVKAAEYEKSMIPFIPLTGDFKNIRVELIKTLKELNHEGSRMQHCIATYSDIMIRKQYVGFRIYNKASGERLTLGCFRDDSNKLYFNQLKGVGNYPAKSDSCKMIIDFCEQKNITLMHQEVHDLMPAFNQ